MLEMRILIILETTQIEIKDNIIGTEMKTVKRTKSVTELCFSGLWKIQLFSFDNSYAAEHIYI